MSACLGAMEESGVLPPTSSSFTVLRYKSTSKSTDPTNFHRFFPCKPWWCWWVLGDFPCFFVGNIHHVHLGCQFPTKVSNWHLRALWPDGGGRTKIFPNVYVLEMESSHGMHETCTYIILGIGNDWIIRFSANLSDTLDGWNFHLGFLSMKTAQQRTSLSNRPRSKRVWQGYWTRRWWSWWWRCYV